MPEYKILMWTPSVPIGLRGISAFSNFEVGLETSSDAVLDNFFSLGVVGSELSLSPELFTACRNKKIQVAKRLFFGRRLGF